MCPKIDQMRYLSRNQFVWLVTFILAISKSELLLSVLLFVSILFCLLIPIHMEGQLPLEL